MTQAYVSYVGPPLQLFNSWTNLVLLFYLATGGLLLGVSYEILPRTPVEVVAKNIENAGGFAEADAAAPIGSQLELWLATSPQVIRESTLAIHLVAAALLACACGQLLVQMYPR